MTQFKLMMLGAVKDVKTTLETLKVYFFVPGANENPIESAYGFY